MSRGLRLRSGSRATSSSAARRVIPLNQMVMEESDSTLDTTDSNKPTPKVPATAFKWPPVWPFATDDFDAIPGAESGVMEGGYSSNQKTKLRDHISNFLSSDDKVLELCSGTSQGIIETSESIVFEDGTIGGANPLAPLLQFHNPNFPSDSNVYDAVILTDGVECLTNPRDVFREVWRVLKPGGKCLVCFTSKPTAIPTRFSPVNKWTTMNDEQKIWIVGSYFQYSAGPGWKGIEGYDAIGSAGDGQLVFTDATGSDVAYVVQAEKLTRRNTDPTPFEDISYALLTAKHMEAEDREYSALRLAAQAKDARSDEERAEIIKRAEKLPEIYAILSGVVDQSVPKPAKAQLANYLLATWENSDEQVQALKRSIGVEPADDFWKTISECTTKLPPREKIVFLAEAVSQVGINDKLAGLPGVMASVTSALRQKYPSGQPDDETASRIEIFTAKIVVSDYLMSDGVAVGERIVRFIDSLDFPKIQALLDDAGVVENKKTMKK